MEQTKTGKRKLEGIITSDKMLKTVVVEISGFRLHPKYLKQYKTRSRFKAHVETNGEYKIGDRVLIEETRPLSKDKRWRVIKKI